MNSIPLRNDMLKKIGLSNTEIKVLQEIINSAFREGSMQNMLDVENMAIDLHISEEEIVNTLNKLHALNILDGLVEG
jgi:predicted transcriptional regulator